MTKKYFYKKVQRLARALNVNVNGRWVGTTTHFWETEYNRLKFRSVLNQVRFRVPNIKQVSYRGGTAEQLKSLISRHIRDGDYYFTVLDDDRSPIILRRQVIINPTSRDTPYFQLTAILNRILANPNEYNTPPGHLIIQIHKQITENPPLQNQRDGDINCACKAVLDVLKKRKQSDRTKRRIKRVEEINTLHFKDGINDDGLQTLSNKSELILTIKDRIGEKWRDFEPVGKSKNHKRLLLVSHNNHISNIHDSDDEDDETIEGVEVDNDMNYFPKENHSSGQKLFGLITINKW
jgi:hypothetical protein